MKHVIPIVYRCDEKYRYFLINSIISVLKHYKDERPLIFYICTNDDLDLTPLDSLQKKYKFTYSLLKIDQSFFNKHDALRQSQQISLKKYFSFNFSEIVSKEHNDTTYTFNPFARSKAIISASMYFLATTHHDYVITLDSDTIVVANIAELYDIDTSNVVASTCRDWGNNPTYFNPSVAVMNIQKFKEIFFKPQGILDELIAINDMKLTDSVPYCEKVQKAINTVSRDVLIVSREWNVPATHINICLTPKIYHFSESWSGNTKVHNIYRDVIDKYLGNDQFEHS
jgi:lipopolysaccharide biosynthesis glycosyltransferase